MFKVGKYGLWRHPNKIYYASWTVREEGKRRSKRETLATASLKEAKERLAEFVEGVEQRVTRNVESVNDLWEAYRADHLVPNTAASASVSCAWSHLLKEFGRLHPSEITNAHAVRYRLKRQAGEIGQPAKPQTVRRELTLFKAGMNWAAKPMNALIRPQDVPAFALPAAAPPRDVWLRQHEIQALFDVAAATTRTDGRLSRVERFLWLALETAARKTAIAELTWGRVDFETNVIHYGVPGARRTNKRRADVPISNALLPVLRRAYAERDSDLVIGEGADVWFRLQTVAKTAGFRKEGATVASGIGPHTLRHTAATHMARRGVPLWKIAGVLGNSMAMVEKVYAKHAPVGLADAVNAISGGHLIAAE